MLSDSPLSPPRNSVTSSDSLSPISGPLAVVLEETDSDDGGLGSEKEVVQPQPLGEPKMSLAAELGVESPPDTPLHENKVGPNIVVNSNPNNGMGRARVFHADPNAKKPPTIQGKGKVKEHPRSSAEAEKENNSKPNHKVLAGKSGRVSPAKSGGDIAVATRRISPTNEPRKPVAKLAAKPMPTTTTKVFTKPSALSGNGGGARRVLITSADAPPIGKARKG
jgi:hypothetical protein